MRSHKLTVEDWHRWATETRMRWASQSGPNFHKLIEMDPYGKFYVRDNHNNTVFEGTELAKAIGAYNDIYE